MRDIEERIRALPPGMQQEVDDFIDFLAAKQKNTKRTPKLGWAGAARDLRDQYTSVELQHRIAEWRIAGP